MKIKNIFVIFTITLAINLLLINFWNPKDISKEMQVQSVFNDNKSIFKSDKVIILENLNDEEMTELNDIFSDLSTFDVSMVSESFSGSDENEIIKSFRRLKRRLPNDKYEKVKEITSSLIDVDELEEIVKNKYE